MDLVPFVVSLVTGSAIMYAGIRLGRLQGRSQRVRGTLLPASGCPDDDCTRRGTWTLYGTRERRRTEPPARAIWTHIAGCPNRPVRSLGVGRFEIHRDGTVTRWNS